MNVNFSSSAQVKIQFQTLCEIELKIQFSNFHVVVATREDLSIDVSITNAGLILTKLR